MTQTATAATAMETTAPNGHITYTLRINGVAVLERWQHVVTGLWYVTELAPCQIGTRLVSGTYDERVAKVAFVKAYKRLTGN